MPKPKKTGSPDAPVTIRIALPYTPPFDWPGALAFFRGHEMTGIESVGGDFYERVFRLGDTTGRLRITAHPTEPKLLVDILASGEISSGPVEAKVRRMFGLDADPETVGKSFRKHRVLGPLWKAAPGLRPSSGWDAFESSIATILGQLVSVKRAKELVRQLVHAYGDRIVHPVTGAEAHLFPTPERLAEAGFEEVGTTGMRKRTLKEFSRRVVAGELDLAGTDIVKTKAALLSIPGIGPWSSEYIALRALANHDSFPGADLILKRALDLHPDMDLDSVSPWKSYAAVLLWHRHGFSSLTETPTKKPAAKAKQKTPGKVKKAGVSHGKRGSARQ